MPPLRWRDAGLRAKMDGVEARPEPRRIMTIKIELGPRKNGSFENGHGPVAATSPNTSTRS